MPSAAGIMEDQAVLSMEAFGHVDCWGPGGGGPQGSLPGLILFCIRVLSCPQYLSRREGFGKLAERTMIWGITPYLSMLAGKISFKPLLGHSFSGLLFPSLPSTVSASFLSCRSIRHWCPNTALYLACISSNITFCFLARSSFTPWMLLSWAEDLLSTELLENKGPQPLIPWGHG